MLFNILPDNFFSLLAAPGKRVYWECIRKLFSIVNKQLSFGVEREALNRRSKVRMSEDPCYEHQWELFGEMLREDRKLEQECLSVTIRPSSDPVC